MQGVEPAPRPLNQQPPSVWAAGIALGIGIACAVAWRQLTGHNRCCHSSHRRNNCSDLGYHTVACKHALSGIPGRPFFHLQTISCTSSIHLVFTRALCDAARGRLKGSRQISRRQCLEAPAQPLSKTLHRPVPGLSLKAMWVSLTFPTAFLL